MMTMCTSASERRGRMTVNSFEKGGDGGGPSACDGHFHSDNDHWVALPPPTFHHNSNCFRKVKMSARGKSTVATVIDECAKPCKDDIVDASESVWKALGVRHFDNDFGLMPITWHFIS
ncbi:hypothetical protein SUGI_0324810 [Cryptomeria japonica]|nr:hypothetical protein SUGI_0324810 [Cryptomeria japonica]